MFEIHREHLVQRAPSVRERAMERLKLLRVIADDVANGAADMNDEKLVRWVDTPHDLATGLVCAAMH